MSFGWNCFTLHFVFNDQLRIKHKLMRMQTNISIASDPEIIFPIDNFVPLNTDSNFPKVDERGFLR